jgi:hypothetical protein
MAEQVKQLGNGGLNTDTPQMIVPLNTFTDVLNVRFFNNSVETITGEILGAVVPSAPNFGIHWRRPDQGYNIFGKNGSMIRVDSAGNQSNMLQSADAKYANSDWHGTKFNGGYAIIINNGKSTPLYALFGDPNAGSTFQELPGWNYTEGSTVTAKVVRALNYSLVAGNITVLSGGTATSAPGTIRVSVQAPTGNVPQVWEPGLTTDTADEFELSSTSPVLEMLDLRGNLYVYSSDSINVVSVANTTRVALYSKSYGILNTDCAVEFDGNHFVVDRNDIYVHNGSGKIESLADARIKKYFFGNLNKNALDMVQVVKHPFYKEIYINYPKGTSTVCNEAMVYNYVTNTWSKRFLGNFTYSFNGPSNKNNQFQYGNEVLYSTTNTTQTLVSDNVYTMWTGSALAGFTSWVEKRRINTGDTMNSHLITAIYPIFDSVPSNASIKISVRGQNNYIDQEPFETKDEFIFLPNIRLSQGYKVDPRVYGRVMNMRISSEGYWSLPTYAFDVKPVDRR